MPKKLRPIDCITTDSLFDVFFKGLFEKPHEHKKECINALYGATLERLDKIINNLKQE